MAVNVGELIVRVGADISALGGALKQAEGQLADFQASTEAGGAALARLGLVAGAAGAAILAGLGLAVRASAEAKREQELLANAIRASGKAIDQANLERLAAQLQRATGVSDELILRQARVLVSFGATQKQVEELIPRILDFSTALDKDLGGSTLAVARALSGNDAALGRLLGNTVKGINLTTDFDLAIRKLDGAFGGAARTAGQTLFGAIGKLRTAFNDLLEVLGSPLLGPLATVVSALANVVDNITRLARQFPEATALVTGFAAAVGLLLLGTGGFLALRVVVPIVVNALASMAPVLLKNAAVAALLGKNMLAFAAATRLALIALQAGIVGGLILLFIHLVRTKDELNALNLAVTKLMLVIRNLAVQQGIPSLSKAVADADEQMKDFTKTVGKTGTETERLNIRSLDLKQTYEELAAASKLVRLESELLANVQARQVFERPGASEADIKAAEVRRQRAIRAAREADLERLIAHNEQTSKKIIVIDERTADEKRKIETTLVEQRIQLDELRRTSAQEVATKIFETERSFAEQRAENARQAVDRDLESARRRVEGTRTIEDAAARADEAVRQRRLQQVRLEEELRIGMLRRVADVERQLSQQIIDARASLLSIQQSQLEAEAIRSAQRRVELVRQGFITEEQARQQAGDEAAANEQRRIEGEIALLRQREKLIQQQFEREVAVANATLESKTRVLVAETQAKKDSLDAQQALRVADLEASVKIAEAESSAKVALLKIQFELQQKLLEQKAVELEAVGDVKAAQNLRDELKALRAGFDESIADLKAAEAERRTTTNSVIAQTRRETDAQKDALDKQLDSQRGLLQLEFSDALFGAMETRNQKLQDIAQRGAALGVDVAQLIVNERNRLQAAFERGDITAEVRDRRLRDIADVERGLTQTTEAAVRKVKEQVTEMDAIWKTFVDNSLVKLQPMKEFFDNILASLKSILALQAGIGPGSPVVAAGGLAGDVTVNNSFNFNGVTITLTADEASMLDRIIKRLLGVEGDRRFAALQGAQAGARQK